ncbi:hypothetical protein M9458_002688, partial [Cirrhinus mrigala]
VVPLNVILPELGIAIWCVWVEHTIPEPTNEPKLPPSLPLPLPLPLSSSPPPPPLHPVRPSVHPEPCGGVGTPRVCQSPLASWLKDPLSPLLASEFRTLLRPIDPVAPPLLLAPVCPPWPISPPALPGFL